MSPYVALSAQMTNSICTGLKMIVAVIYANFSTSIYEHGDMAHRDGYLSGPVDQDRFSVILEAI